MGEQHNDRYPGDHKAIVARVDLPLYTRYHDVEYKVGSMDVPLVYRDGKITVPEEFWQGVGVGLSMGLPDGYTDPSPAADQPAGPPDLAQLAGTLADLTQEFCETANRDAPNLATTARSGLYFEITEAVGDVRKALAAAAGGA